MQKQARKIVLLIKFIWLARKLAYVSSLVLIPAMIYKAEIIVNTFTILVAVSVLLAEFLERIYIGAKEEKTSDAKE